MRNTRVIKSPLPSRNQSSPGAMRALQACPFATCLQGRRQLDSTAPELRGALCRRRSRQAGVSLVVAHYRFPHPVEKDRRLTGSKSKKVIRLWQTEVAREEVLRVRDELFLLLRRYKQGLQLDDLWPALRRMVRSRPGAFSPVTAGRLDKPDRTFQKIIETAGYRNVKAFLQEQPEVVLTGEGSRICASLTPEYLVAHAQQPEQPSEASSSVARVVVKQSRIRDLSAQLLGVDNWRSEAAAWGRQRARDMEAAARLLSLHGLEAQQPMGAEPEAGDGAADGDDVEETREAEPSRRSGVPLAAKFPAWRKVRPPRQSTAAPRSRRPTDPGTRRAVQ